MKKRIILFLFILLNILIITGCQKKEVNHIENEIIENNEGDIAGINSYSTINGTADTIEGKTIIISVFASEEKYQWHYDNNEDIDNMNNTLKYLKIATDYLTKEVDNYNKKAEFIYDWSKYPDLKYTAKFNEKIVENYNSIYDIEKEWLVNNIDIKKLKDKYQADNLIFMYFYNTDNTNLAVTSTYNQFDIDIVNIFIKHRDYDVPPATYAHELLHTFGAPDLYFENIIINQDYVDYLLETGTNDIMFTVTSNEEITNTFSSLDAYYVGLIDSHPDIEKWNLGISEHLLD